MIKKIYLITFLLFVLTNEASDITDGYISITNEVKNFLMQFVEKDQNDIQTDISEKQVLDHIKYNSAKKIKEWIADVVKNIDDQELQEIDKELLDDKPKAIFTALENNKEHLKYYLHYLFCLDLSGFFEYTKLFLNGLQRLLEIEKFSKKSIDQKIKDFDKEMAEKSDLTKKMTLMISKANFNCCEITKEVSNIKKSKRKKIKLYFDLLFDLYESYENACKLLANGYLDKIKDIIPTKSMNTNSIPNSKDFIKSGQNYQQAYF